MSRHRNVRKISYEDELSDDIYGRSLDDVDYAVSPATEEQFMYTRASRQHATLFSYMERSPAVVQEEEEENFEDYDQHLSHSQEDYKRPDLDSVSQAKLQSCLEQLQDILGDNCYEPTAVDAIIRNRYDVEKALDQILSKGGKQTLSSEPTSPPRDYSANNNYDSVKSRPVKKKSPSPSKPPATANDTKEEQFIMKLPKPAPRKCISSEPISPKPISGPISPNSEKNCDVADDSLDSTTAPSTARIFGIRNKDLIDVKAEYKKRQEGKELLNLIVIGHVDAGKSTLMGHLLYKLGNVSKRSMHKNEQESKKVGKGSFAFAWVLDETDEERTRGITMDVAMTTFETDTKTITLMDAPGHRDFIPNMIQGTAQADVAILVIGSSRGEFESGFEAGGQTREHALLARSLGVGQLVVAVNKLDMVDWSKDRYEEIVGKLRSFLKQVGFKESDVSYIPCCGLDGQNLISKATDPILKSWYKGHCLSHQIDKFKSPKRPIDKPFRICVSDVYKGTSGTCMVAGKLEAGTIQNGQKVLLMPAGENGLIKALTMQEESVKWAAAGDHVTLTISGVDMAHVSVGSVLCDHMQPIKATSKIVARIVVFNTEMPIVKGFMVIFHCQCLSEPATITKLYSILHKSTGDMIQKRPRCLPKHSNAVIQIKTARPVCVELYKDNKVLGRFMLRYGGKTIAAGVVTEIK